MGFPQEHANRMPHRAVALLGAASSPSAPPIAHGPMPHAASGLHGLMPLPRVPGGGFPWARPRRSRVGHANQALRTSKRPAGRGQVEAAEGTWPVAGLQPRRLPAAQPPPAPLLGRPARELAPLPLLAAAVPAGRRSPTAALRPRHPGRATAEPPCQERRAAPRAAATTQTASSKLEQGGEEKIKKIKK